MNSMKVIFKITMQIILRYWHCFFVEDGNDEKKNMEVYLANYIVYEI